MPSEVTTGQPPMSPDVARQQQQSPVGQYANKAAAQQGGGQGGDPAMQMVQQKMASIAQMMTEIAQVTVQTKPQLMPILKKIAGGFKEFENQFNQQQQGPGQQQPVGSEPPPEATGEQAAVAA